MTEDELTNELTTIDQETGEILPPELTPAEEAKLARCEADIEAGLLQAWRALRTIWQERLYRSKFDSFDKYCKAKWGITHARAHQLIDAANLVDYVSTNGLHEAIIPNERTARAVLEIEPEKRLPVLMLAHKAADGKLDSGWIKDAAEVHQEIQATGGFIDDGEGGMVEAHRAVVDHRMERLNRQHQHIRDSEDGKRKSVRLVDFAPFRVIDADGVFRTAKIIFEDADTARQFVAFYRHGEPRLRLTVSQVAPDPYNAPLSLTAMAAARACTGAASTSE